MPAETAAGAPNPFSFLLLPVAIFLIFYFVVFRAERKREKERKKMLEQLKTGDRVITSGGICGTIHAVRGNRLEMEIARGVRVEILRSAVASVETPAQAAESP